METLIKSYGNLIAPILAFGLGVLAIYIKFYVDRHREAWKSRRKLKKLVQLIIESAPPENYFPQINLNGFHADQARNMTNLAIFRKRMNVVSSFIESIENDILTNCTISALRQFHDLKFIVSYLERDIAKYQNSPSPEKEEDSTYSFLSQQDFLSLQHSYNRLLSVCHSSNREFNYIISSEYIE